MGRMTGIEKLNQKIEASNARFDSLSKAKKRIVVAKDVLEGLKLRAFRAAHDGYIHATQYPTVQDVSRGDVSEAQTKLKNCTACALGSMFVCSLPRISDSVKKFYDKSWFAPYHNVIPHGRTIEDMFSDIFDRKQMGLIESAYEMDDYFAKADECSEEETQRAVKFGERYRSPALRLRRIMENIVRHNGEFVPPARDWRRKKTTGKNRRTRK